MIKIKFSLSIGLSGGEQDDLASVADYGYSDEEWLALTPKEKEALINEWVTDWAGNYIDYSGVEII